MRTAVAIRHVHFEDLGSFAAPIEAAGYQVRYLDPGIDELRLQDIAAADLLVVLGGPVGAYQGHLYPILDEELGLLRCRLAAGAPTLGICLGAQLMARALGARVAPGYAKEIGWAPVDLTDAGRDGPLRHLDGVPVLHWHGDALDLPPGAECHASTALCPNQAFALGRTASGSNSTPRRTDGALSDGWSDTPWSLPACGVFLSLGFARTRNALARRPARLGSVASWSGWTGFRLEGSERHRTALVNRMGGA